MSGFRTPEIAREQMVLWERRLEDAIPDDHQVRHLDLLLGSAAFSETFRKMERSYVLNLGKPPYHPGDLASLYLYGMLHRIRSSRQLEDACHCRLDVIWLMKGQTPDHSTIADFVGQHGKTLRRLFRDTLGVLIEAKLVKLSQVAIDGSKVEADAGRNSVRGEEKLRSWQTHLDEQIAALEREWAENERREANLFGQSNPWTNAPGKDAKKALGQLKRKQEKLNQALAQLKRRQEAQVGGKPPKRIASTTDPDSRSMKDKEGRSKPNYNTQVAVDDTCGAIVAAEVNDEPDDSGQLTPMVEQVIENCGDQPSSVSADSQYNTGPDLAAMEEMQIDCYLPDAGQNSVAAPSPEAGQEALAQIREGRELSESQWAALPRNNNKLIDKSAFAYDAEKDEYRCPSGRSLVFLRVSQDKKKWGTARRRQYGGGAACGPCPHVKLCCQNPEKGRLISRDQYEGHRQRLRRRMATEQGREIYKRRRHTVEPRIGHLKHNLGVRRFLRRGLEKVKTEWTMVCTAVNLGIMLRHWEQIVKTL
jgi:transposase